MDRAARFDPALYPRTYTASPGWTLGLCALGTLAAAPGLAGIWYFGTGHEVKGPGDMAMLVGICAVFVLLGAYLIASVLRGRIVLTADELRMHGIWLTRVVPRADVAGYRLLSANGIQYVNLRRRSGKKVNVALLFRPDPAFAAWLEGKPDDDAVSVAMSMQEVAQDASLGATEEERLRKLGLARKGSGALHAAAVGVALWAFFYPQPLALGLLAVLPWFAMALVASYSGYFTLEDSGLKSARPDLGALVLLPGWVLALRALFDVHLIELDRLAAFAAGGLALMAGALVMAEPRLRHRTGKLVLYALLLVPYTAAVPAIGNAVFDRAPPERHRVTVLGKHATGGRSPTYYLTLPPWGPYQEADDVGVYPELYGSVEKGQPVCVLLYHGALKMPFFVVRDASGCP
jgi:hypothetical protein